MSNYILYKEDKRVETTTVVALMLINLYPSTH